MSNKIIQLNQFRKQPTSFEKNQTLDFDTYLTGDEIIYNKSPNQELFEIFIFNCDPKLKHWELSHNGLKDLQQIQEIFPKDLEDTIKQLQTSNFYFNETLSDFEYSSEIIIQEDKITNHLISQYKLNISKVTSLGYTRFFQLFCDRYNGINELDSDFELFTKDQIRYLAVKENNQNVLKTIVEFPQINEENLEYFLQYWNDTVFDKNSKI